MVDCTREFHREITTFFKSVLGNQKKLIICEDIDGLNNYSRSAFLNFIDGLDGLDNTLVIATTNNVDKVDYALVNRPSRFDRMYNFELPDIECRKALLVKFFPELKGEELIKTAKATEDFSGAYFKELFIFKHLQNCSILEAIDRMNEQVNLFKESKAHYVG